MYVCICKCMLFIKTNKNLIKLAFQLQNRNGNFELNITVCEKSYFANLPLFSALSQLDHVINNNNKRWLTFKESFHLSLHVIY